MFHFKALAAVPALVFLMGGTAHAALTADQVWQSWKDGAAQAGLTITAATEANSGGVLTLNGVTIAPEGADYPITISDITLTEQSDGTVSIKPGAAINLSKSDESSSTKVDLLHDGLEIVASEAAGSMSYAYKAKSVNVAYDVTTEGYSFDETETAPPEVKNTGKFGFEDVSGTYSDTPGTNRAFGLDLAAAKFIFDSATDDAGMGIKSTNTSETADVKLDLDVVLPSSPFADLEGPDGFRKALEEGFSLTGAFTQGESKGTGVQENEFFPYSMVMGAAGGDAKLSFNKDFITLNQSSGNFSISVTSEAFPGPMDMSMAETLVDLKIPVIATTPQDLIAKVKLGQLVLSEGVWGMFDPGAALKRDAADLNIDIAARTTMDLPAMAEAEETGAEPPIPQVEKLDITDISLKVAGAALTTVGAFTFDNTPGFPMPLGNATINVDGANALIDGLIKTGLMAEEDASGMRMMMAMFMKPSGNGDDSLVSEIEVKEGMQVLVNGQPLPM